MDRPYVILNAAMTLDGKISTVGGDSRISCEEDFDRVHRLRAEVDAIMVGKGTVSADDPRLTVRRVEGENPIRVILDSGAEISPEAKVLDDSAETIVAISERADNDEIERLRDSNVRPVVKGGERVDPEDLLKELKGIGVERLLLEGGSELNWSMLSSGLVDEVRIAVSPVIVGGEEAKTLVGGRGVEKIPDGIGLNLLKTEKVGRDLLLTYEVEDHSSV